MAQLQVRYNGLDIRKTCPEILYTLVPEATINPLEIVNLTETKWHSINDGNLKLNRLPQSLLLKIPINSILKQGNFDYLSISNPHINYLHCWIIRNQILVKEFTFTGDNLPFSTRNIPVTNFDFPIHGSDYANAEILVMADKRFTNLSVPLNFYTKEYYGNDIQNQNLIWGIIIGIFLFICLLNLFLAFLLKLTLFLWYALFQTCIIVYIFADNGYFFKIIYPSFPALNDLIRPFSLAFGIVPLVLFFNVLLDLKNKLPKLKELNKFILLFYIPLFVIAIITTSSGDYAIQGLWLQVNKVLGPLLLLILLVESIYCFIKKIHYAIFATIAYTGTTIFIVIYSLHQNELVPDNFFNSRSNYWALIWELLVMSFALTYRYRFYQLQSEILAQKNKEQQTQLFTETVSFQEKEMQRISSLLHDTVGANLGLLRMEADQMDLTEIARENLAIHITQLGHEVRNMSHRLSPILLEDKGLYHSIEDIVQRINASSKIDLQFEWIGDRNGLNPQYSILTYRIIQELLQNLIKHSQAKTAFLQIMVEQQLISIYLEDDGVGFIQIETQQGVGLKSIQKLTQLLNGSFQINSKQDEGFSISIEFNLDKYENI